MVKKPVVISLSDYAFIDNPTGASRLAYELCMQQVKWGYEVYLICRNTFHCKPAFEVRDGINILRVTIKKRPSPDPRNAFNIIRETRCAANKILSKHDVDAIHSHNPLMGIGAVGVAGAHKVPVIHSIHSPWVLEMKAGKNWIGEGRIKNRTKEKVALILARWMEGYCFRKVDALTCFSMFTMSEIIKEHPGLKGKEKLSVLPGWVNTSRFNPEGGKVDWRNELGRPEKRPVLLTVRGLKPRNGLELLIGAASMVKEEGGDFELAIIGEGPLRTLIQEKIDKLGLRDRVTLLGRVDDDELTDFYRSCDCFVLPTMDLECFGIIVLEALASGKPVIATPVGAIPEILTPVFPDGLVKETTSEELAKAMIKYIKSIEKGEDGKYDSEKFRNYVCEHYSIEKGTVRFRQVYEAGQ